MRLYRNDKLSATMMINACFLTQEKNGDKINSRPLSVRAPFKKIILGRSACDPRNCHRGEDDSCPNHSFTYEIQVHFM